MTTITPAIDFGRYYDFQGLTDALRSLADAYPDLATLSSIGKTHQGRDIWLLGITSPKGEPADAKPAFYIDANTHAEELTGSNVALYTAWYLLTNYGRDAEITHLLDWQTFYIIPRVDPDGAEIVLKMPFYEWIGNGRYLPGEEQFGPGLHYADINGDGMIVDMRIPDPAGEWKISQADPRLMIPREPYEYGGQYYRLLPEGLIDDYDGAEIPIPRPMDGNMNRNYPANWGPEGIEYGGGDWPMSEPEIEAVVKFVKTHPNIVSGVNYHTNAGVILPPTRKITEGQDLQDLFFFQKLGEIVAAETGYRVVLSEADFSFPGAKPRMGTSSDFLYGQLGIACLTTELWDVFAEAGIQHDWFFPLRELSEEENLKLLKWSDERLNGEGFAPWTPFEHPQLGQVEIGGWRRLFMFRNPPADELERICHRNAQATFKHALMAPKIGISNLKVDALGQGIFRLEAIVENVGYMPSNITGWAIKMKVAQPVTVRLEAPEGVEIVGGRAEVDLGHLAGRSDRTMKYSRFRDWAAHKRKAQWIVQLKGVDQADVSIWMRSRNGGQDRRDVTLGPDA